MSMRFKVEIVVDIDVNDWTEEYGTTGAAESLTQILGDLRERDNYLAGGKWADLAKVVDVKAQLAVFNARQLEAIAKAMAEPILWTQANGTTGVIEADDLRALARYTAE